MDKKIGILLNTVPITESKAGIGYYVYNLYTRIKDHKDFFIFPVHHLRRGFVKTDKILKIISSHIKLLLRKKYPKKLAASIYNVCIMPSIIISRYKIKKILPFLHIYHETRHVLIQEMIPYLDKVKLVSDIHDLSPILYPQWHLPEHVKEVKNSIKKIIDLSHFILVKSEFIKKQIIQELGIDEQRIFVIPNAPAANYRPLSEEEKIKAKQNIAHIIGDTPFILYTGTIEPRKNLKVLFDAFKIIMENHSINLIIAGGRGWLYNNIISYPQKIGIENRVKFLGYTSEKMLLYLFNLCEIFVFPSWYEGFGMPPLEAMSCGAVPIVSNSSSLPEVVGECGLLFDPASPDELAEKIRFLLTHKEIKNNLSKRCIERAKRYNWETVVQRIIEVYKKMV